MSLKDELKLKKDFETTEHEALLNIYHSASLLKKQAAAFFSEHATTDVQFNLLLLLYRNSDATGGLTQVQLSDMMLVNRANITSLIDRMENAGLVARTDDPADRRSNIIRLTSKGRKLIEKIEKDYIDEIRRIMSVLKDNEMKNLITMLEKVRANLNREK